MTHIDRNCGDTIWQHHHCSSNYSLVSDPAEVLALLQVEMVGYIGAGTVGTAAPVQYPGWNEPIAG